MKEWAVVLYGSILYRVKGESGDKALNAATSKLPEGFDLDNWEVMGPYEEEKPGGGPEDH